MFALLEACWRERRWLGWHWLMEWFIHHTIRHDNQKLIDDGIMPRAIKTDYCEPMSPEHVALYNQVAAVLLRNELVTHQWHAHPHSFYNKAAKVRRTVEKLINAAKAANQVQVNFEPNEYQKVRNRLPFHASSDPQAPSDPQLERAVAALSLPLDSHLCDCLPKHERPLPFILPCGHVCCAECARSCFPHYPESDSALSMSTTARRQLFEQWFTRQRVRCPVCQEETTCQKVHDLVLCLTPDVSASSSSDGPSTVIPSKITKLVERAQQILLEAPHNYIVIYTEVWCSPHSPAASNR